MNLSLGVKGEIVAVKLLMACGFEIVEQNYKCQLGEVDIVASRHGSLMFVEVKTRSSTDYGYPAEAVTAKKQAKIRRLAECYLVTHPNHKGEVEFGVIEVLYSYGQGRYTTHLIRHAF